MKLRVCFEKLGAIKFSSHKDIVRMFQRSFAACDVPIAYSEGFRPHMKMSFGPPLKTGWVSDAEYMDIDVVSPAGADFAARCNERLPAGLKITHVTLLPQPIPKLAADISAATYQVTVRAKDAYDRLPSAADSRQPDRADTLRKHIEANFVAKVSEDGVPRILSVIVEDGVNDGEDTVGITYTSTMLSGKIIAPRELLEKTIGDPDEFQVPIEVKRLASFVERDGEYLSPIDKGVVQNSR